MGVGLLRHKVVTTLGSRFRLADFGQEASAARIPCEALDFKFVV